MPEVYTKDNHNEEIFNNATFRNCVTSDDNQCMVMATDTRQQPQIKKTGSPSKSTRSFAVCSKDDIAVVKFEDTTAERTNFKYLTWLNSLNLGPEKFVSFTATPETVDVPLSQLIVNNPTTVIDAITKNGKSPVLVPFYSGSLESQVAQILNAELFGAPNDVSYKFFSKDSFKQTCQDLKIETVGGQICKVPGLTTHQLAKIVGGLLHTYPKKSNSANDKKVLVRGALGAAGSSAYTLDSTDVREVLGEIKKSKDNYLLVEPFLKVVASPNDQWSIGLDGGIHHLGTSAQLFNDLKHVGNLYGPYFSKRVLEYIQNTSLIITRHMQEQGYKGVLGIDYIVTPDKIYPIENNARLNGSTFTIGIIDNLAEQLGTRPECWKFYKAHTEPCDFDELIKKIPALYDGTSVNCAFPYDCDTIRKDGMFELILMGEDMSTLDSLEKEMRKAGIINAAELYSPLINA